MAWSITLRLTGPPTRLDDPAATGSGRRRAADNRHQQQDHMIAGRLSLGSPTAPPRQRAGGGHRRANPHTECETVLNTRCTAGDMTSVSRPPPATVACEQDTGSRTSERDRRRPGSRMVNPTVTEPDVVPMTIEQHDRAVAVLATMICDWLHTRGDRHSRRPRALPATAASRRWTRRPIPAVAHPCS